MSGPIVTIMAPREIDAGVILGYRPDREIDCPKLVIGPNARLRSGTVIYLGSIIGRDLETGHNVVIREQNKIGDCFKIWSNSVVDYGCRIGNNVRVHNAVYIAQFTTIEDDVFIAPGVTVANDLHPICTGCMLGPTIRAGAKIGINATLLPRVEIGQNALVGAGAVVTRSVEPGMVVAGNPAKVVGAVKDLDCVYGEKGKAYPELSADGRDGLPPCQGQ